MCVMAYVESTVMLSPSGEALACPGEQLAFVCSTNRNFIEWNITLFLSGGQSTSRTRLVPSVGPIETLVVDTMSFHIIRNESLSLTSILTIASVTTDLNGTRVNCTDIGSSLAETSTSVSIIKIGS